MLKESGQTFKNTLARKTFSSFRKKLDGEILAADYFSDSLSINHYLAAYQVKMKPYDQNMASLLNNDLIIHIYDFDDHLPCYSIENIGALQYASKYWKALKFKYEISPIDSCDSPDSQVRFATFFYFNNNKKAYYFLEFNASVEDLDSLLRRVQM